MRNWNRVGLIKAAVLLLLAIPNLVFPAGVGAEDGWVSLILSPLIIGTLIIPLVAKFNEKFLKRVLVKPRWNDNPLHLKRPLTMFHFAAWFFIVLGASMILGTALQYQSLNQFGFMPVAFGAGMLIGVWLSLKWARKDLSTVKPG